MENQSTILTPSPPMTQPSSNFMEWTWQNMAILILIVLLLFSFLGINLLTVFGNVFQQFANLVIPFIERVLNILGFTLGSFANISADVIEDVGKSSLTILNDGVHDITDVMMNGIPPRQNETPDHTHPAPAPVQTDHLDKDLSKGPTVDVSNAAIPSSSSSPMQTSIAATSKSSWCLTGEYKERRGCIEIGENDRCMSGQVFPTQALCLNPNIQPYQ